MCEVELALLVILSWLVKMVMDRNHRCLRSEKMFKVGTRFSNTTFLSLKFSNTTVLS